MVWPSCSSNVVEVDFCRTKCNKMAVIHLGYYFHHNRKYKGGDYWCCAHRGCKVRLISSRVNHETGQMEFSRRNKSIKHDHRPNAPNLIEKEFRRQLITQFNKVRANETGSSQQAASASVRVVYDQLLRQAIERGIPESLIPPFANVRSSMYRIRHKRESTQSPSNKNSEIRENIVTSAGEGSNSRSGSSAQESLISSGDASSPEQTEPLCLVISKSSALPVPQQVIQRSQTPQSSPILYQTLQSPSPSVAIPFFQSRPTQFEAMAPPIDTNVLQYSSTFSPNYLTPLPQTLQTLGQSEMLQYYAAMHAEYVRSLIALNLHHRY